MEITNPEQVSALRSHRAPFRALIPILFSSRRQFVINSSTKPDYNGLCALALYAFVRAQPLTLNSVVDSCAGACG